MFRNVLGTLMAGAVVLAAQGSLAAEYTMKLTITDPEPTAPERHYGRTGLIAFAEEVNEKSGGRIEAKIYWGAQLGKVESVLNLVRNGQVEAAVASDGHVAPYFPDIEILGIPYLFIDRKVAYDVFDGEFGRMLSDRMAEQSGIRPLPWLENGGYRHYSSNKQMETVEDMEGLKIRTMNNP
ncbi:MAG: TRAP transporter substrate-binding protein DctP, partial [Geminicoccaceae bacterium]|nr:TRAP transporter substrate-binding protein DctP [Geminicoccaceae bacterium]